MRYIFCPFVLLATTAVSAQLKKGDLDINTGTNVLMNLRLGSNDGLKTYNVGVNPNIGYFLKDRWEIGGGPLLSFEGSKFKDPASPYSFKNKSRSTGVNLFTRYYFKTAGKLVPYVTINAAYTHVSGNSTDNNGIKNSFRLNQWQAGGGIGASWFIAPKVALFGELTYSGRWGSHTVYSNGLNLNVGFQFFLKRKKSK